MRRVPQHDSVHVTGQIDYGHDAQARVECRQLRAAVVGGRRAPAPAARARFVPDAARPTEHSEQPWRHRRHPTTTTPTSHRRSGAIAAGWRVKDSRTLEGISRQMYSPRSASANDEPLAYINCYINGYERPGTSSDMNPR